LSIEQALNGKLPRLPHLNKGRDSKLKNGRDGWCRYFHVWRPTPFFVKTGHLGQSFVSPCGYWRIAAPTVLVHRGIAPVLAGHGARDIYDTPHGFATRWLGAHPRTRPRPCVPAATPPPAAPERPQPAPGAEWAERLLVKTAAAQAVFFPTFTAAKVECIVMGTPKCFATSATVVNPNGLRCQALTVTL
jgi:hypothetical protein